MNKYNIYKEVDNEKILIDTVTDVRKVTFKVDETGDVKYVITKVNEKGESSEVPSNELVILGKPNDLRLIKMINYCKLGLSNSRYTENKLVQKSYDNSNWIDIYKGTDNEIELEKESEPVYYRYFTYTDYSISPASNVLYYDVTMTYPLDLHTEMIDDKTVRLHFDNTYYKDYLLFLNDNFYNGYSKETNYVDLEYDVDGMQLYMLATNGMETSTETIYVDSTPLPDTPEEFTYQAFNKEITLSWKKRRSCNYTLYMNDKLIFENIDDSKYKINVDDYGIYKFQLYAENINAISIDAAELEVQILPKPIKYEIINDVNDDYTTDVKLIVYDEIPKNTEIILTGSNYADFSYGIPALRVSSNIVPKSYRIDPDSVYDFYWILYKDNNSFSDTSEIIKYEAPRPKQSLLVYEETGKVRDGIKEYIFSWNKENADSYEIYKNGILMKRLSKDSHVYTMSCLIGDYVCLHSNIGYNHVESNTIRVGYDDYSLTKPYLSDMNIYFVADKQIDFIFNHHYPYQVELYVEKDGEKELIETLDTTSYTYTGKYGNNRFYIRYINDKGLISDFSNPLDVWCLSKPQKIEFIELDKKLKIYLDFVEKATSYDICCVDKDGNVLSLFNDVTTRSIELPNDLAGNTIRLYYVANIDGLSYINVSDKSDIFTYEVPDINFNVEVNQKSELPHYSNKVLINVEEMAEYRFPDVFDIIITKTNGEVVTFENLKYKTYDTEFVFGNPFGYPFGISTDVFPFQYDLKELTDATIEVVGWVGFNKYSIFKDYIYHRIPEQSEFVEVFADYYENNYIYHFKFKYDNNATELYYKLTTDDDSIILKRNITTNFVDFVSDKHIDNFQVYAYNRTGQSEPCSIETQFIDKTTAFTEDFNEKVMIYIAPLKDVLYNKYKVYYDDVLTMNSNKEVFQLKQSSVVKDITVRCCYEEGILRINGLPYTFEYNHHTLEEDYKLAMRAIDNKWYRFQLENEEIEPDVRYINIYTVDIHNNTKLWKTLDIPIDDFKYVFELDQEQASKTVAVYFRLGNGFDYKNTNYIELADGYIMFGEPFGYPFIS